MIDFFQGEKKNFNDIDKDNQKSFHGGDLQGIIDKLDYIKGLGATAIWITPIVKNDAHGYHGYWAINFYEVDPHFGNIDTFKELVDTAHQKDIKVILDIVVNHTGKNHPFVKQKPHWFHPIENIENWHNQKEVEDKCLAGLPDFNQEVYEVKQYLLNMVEWWIKTTNIDGFRIDTVKHVPRTFLERVCPTC